MPKFSLNDLSVKGKHPAQMKTDFVAENRNDVSLQPVYRTHFLTHAGTNPVPNDEGILSPLGRYVNRKRRMVLIHTHSKVGKGESKKYLNVMFGFNPDIQVK